MHRSVALRRRLRRCGGVYGVLWGAILTGQELRGCLGEAASNGTSLKCAYNIHDISTNMIESQRIA